MKLPMKFNRLVAILLSAAAGAQAAPSNSDPTSQSPQAFPKNLARQHLGANLLMYNADKQTYVSTEAAAAWLDDDVATGWPAAAGHQYYMVELPEPNLINNFCISARSNGGTVSIYAGDEAAPPTAKSWYTLAKDAPIESINQKIGKPFARFAKYLLIETNLPEAGPWYSVYVYGEKPALAYHLQHRAQPVDPRSILGPYVNAETNFSLSSLYAHGEVSYAKSDESASALQKVIDDNPETGIAIAPSDKEGSLVIRYDAMHPIQRISVLTDGSAKGKLDFFLLTENQAAAAQPAVTSSANKSEYIKASNVIETAPTAAENSGAVNVANFAPIATIKLDGTNPRSSADFSPIPGKLLVARWTPENPGQLLAVREVNSFSDTSLSDTELAQQSPSRSGTQADYSKDGKETLAPVGEGKETLPPAVGEALPPKTPFVPGLPPSPPNITVPPSSP
jgi:hypothetical protein